MAKKYARREHISVRRKREEALKRKKLTKKQWIIIGSVSAAVVLGVILFFACYMPAGALPVRGGAVAKGGDNWMVANLNTTKKPYYYHTANLTPPEGYTLDPEYKVKEDKLFDERYFINDDENAAVRSAYYTTVTSEKRADELMTSTAGYYTNSIGPEAMEVNGLTWKYRVGDSAFTNEDGSTSRQVTAYLDSPDGRYTLLCQLSSHTAQPDALPDAAKMLDALPDLLKAISLPE